MVERNNSISGDQLSPGLPYFSRATVTGVLPVKATPTTILWNATRNVSHLPAVIEGSRDSAADSLTGTVAMTAPTIACIE